MKFEFVSVRDSGQFIYQVTYMTGSWEPRADRVCVRGDGYACCVVWGTSIRPPQRRVESLKFCLHRLECSGGVELAPLRLRWIAPHLVQATVTAGHRRLPTKRRFLFL